MNEKELITYAPGEKRCESCGVPLGEITCTKFQSRFFCSKPECRYPRGMMVPIQFIAPDKQCDAYLCENLVEKRAYPASQKFFFCSDLCRTRFMSTHSGVQAKCAHCGKDLGKRKPSDNGLHFCRGHNAKYFARLEEVAALGCYLPIYERYKNEFANDHYRDTKHPLDVVRRFLALQVSEGILDIQSIGIDQIDKFKAKHPGQNGRADLLKVFFDYLILEGIYTRNNPVDPALHYDKEFREAPRPYDEETVANLWKWANQRGDTRANLILAFGLEFGPKEFEVLNIRTQDIDRAKQVIWLRWSNPEQEKDQYSHFAPYSAKTKYWLDIWLAERPKNCGHEFLLTNEQGRPLGKDSFLRLLNDALMKNTKFRQYDEGLDVLSFRRIRATNIAFLRSRHVKDNVNMAVHGILAVRSIKRFDLLPTASEISNIRNALD